MRVGASLGLISDLCGACGDQRGAVGRNKLYQRPSRVSASCVFSISPETQSISSILPILQMGILSLRIILESYLVCMDLE